jgi:beta-galactosidase/beta-glucuronidase
MGRMTLPMATLLGTWMLSSCLSATTLPETIDLSGTWELRLDPKDAGISESWQKTDYPDRIKLPGSLQAQGFGERPTMNSNWTGQLIQLAESKHEKVKRYLNEKENFKMPNWLQPERVYVGAAWYQKEIEIPESWKGKRAVLYLERPHWETRVWVDDTYISSHDGLGVPHEHDLTQALPPGRHRLTIRVDNRLMVDVGNNAHSVSDHTQSNWNGMVGALELRATDPVWLDDIQVYPDAGKKSASVRVKMGNISGAAGSEMLRWSVGFDGKSVREGKQSITWHKAGAETKFEIQLGPDARLWDQFHPNLYQLQVRLERAGEQKQVTFGLRDFRAEGTQFTINGRKLFLRGTLECAIFPLTGYPPTDVESWRRIVRIYRNHGLNHIRFHSWCPLAGSSPIRLSHFC